MWFGTKRAQSSHFAAHILIGVFIFLFLCLCIFLSSLLFPYRFFSYLYLFLLLMVPYMQWLDDLYRQAHVESAPNPLAALEQLLPNLILGYELFLYVVMIIYMFTCPSIYMWYFIFACCFFNLLNTNPFYRSS